MALMAGWLPGRLGSANRAGGHPGGTDMESGMRQNWKTWIRTVLGGGLVAALSMPPPSFPLSGSTVLKNPDDVLIVSVAHRKRARHNGWSSAIDPRAPRAAPGPDPACPGLNSWGPPTPPR